MSSLHLFLFGAPHIERDGRAVAVPRRKVMALVAYLAATRQPQGREALAALLWPEADRDGALNSLRRTLSIANGLVGQAILAARDTVALNEAAGVWVDVAHFRALVQGCQGHGHAPTVGCPHCVEPLRAAVALARGDFLAGFSLPDSSEWDEWQFFQAEALRREVVGALERLAGCLRQQGDWQGASDAARRWVAAEPLHEPAHRLLMECYARAGQPAAALRQYGLCQKLLDEGLGVPPDAETTRLYEAIRARQLAPVEPLPPPAPDIQPSPPSPAPPAPPPSMAEATPFIGREAELAEIGRLLGDPACRLLTLVGLGGMGKTRLALQTLAQPQSAFADGACFVALAGAESPALLAPTIAAALGLDLSGPQGEQAQLVDFLRGKRLLVALDNFEHLLDGADLLPELLAAAPGVKLLVTSREPLRLREEWLLEVGGLQVPTGEAAGDAPEADALEAYSAPRLFVQSARRVHRGFTLAASERAAVLRICRLVEGMPLAIELAAAWVRVLGCAEIADEIERNLSILDTTLRNVPERHRSVRAVFEKSWHFLPGEARTLFKRLSVFRGGLRREAAEAVAGASLPTLLLLVDKSFLRRSAAGRYEMHELLRQFAAEKLAASPSEEGATRAAHSAFLAAWMGERAAPLRAGSRQPETLADIRADVENARAGWRWAVRHAALADLEAYRDTLYSFLKMQSWLHEGQQSFGEAAAALADAHPALAASLAAREAMFLFYLGQNEAAQPRLAASLKVAEQGGDEGEAAFALDGLGLVARVLGNTGDAARYHEASLAIRQRQGDRWGSASALRNLAAVRAAEGRFEEAWQRYEESLALRQALGDQAGVADSLFGLGSTAYTLGKFHEARAFFEQALPVQERMGDQRGSARTVYNLGLVAHALGEYAVAAHLYERTLDLSRDMGERRGLAGALRSLGDMATALGHYDAAEAHLEESCALYHEIGYRRGEAVSLLTLSLLAGSLDRWEAAQQRALEGLALAQALADQWTMAYACLALGDARVSLGDPTGAEQLLEESLHLARQTGDRNCEALVLQARGKLARAQGDAPTARRALHDALQVAWDIRAIPLVTKLLLDGALVLQEAGQNKLALASLRAAASHPASEYATRDRAARLLAQVPPGTPDEPSPPLDLVVAEALAWGGVP